MSTLTKTQLAELQALRDLPEEAIDTTDIPEVTAMQNPQRGLHYSPPAQNQVPIYLDDDVRVFLEKRAENLGVEVSHLANKLLAQDIDLAKTLEAA